MTADTRVEHELAYRYEPAAQGSVTVLFVRPREDSRQSLQEFTLETDPAGPVSEFVDGFGNRGHFLTRHHPHRELRIVARSRVGVARPRHLTDATGPDSPPGLEPRLRAPEVQLMLQPSRFVRPLSPALDRFIGTHRIERDENVLRGLRTLASKLFEVFEYAPGTTAADSPIECILETGQGVCQDYTHVMASIARRWGIPARYVSGYLAPDGSGADPGESHAWVECWLPGPGWVGFDPANDGGCDDRHVRVAVGRDYADVPPARGIFHGCAASTLATRVAVIRDEPGRRGDAPFDVFDNSNQRSRESCDPTISSSVPAASVGSRLPWG